MSGPCGISLWKSIRHEWFTFSHFLQFDVGDGTRVKFRQDLWCGDYPLKVAFLELYSITCDKDSLVAEVMQHSTGVIHWDVHFSRPIHDWELESLVGFKELIYSRPVRDAGFGKLCFTFLDILEHCNLRS